MRLMRLWLTALAWGIGLGAAFTAALIWLNVANLGHLLTTSNTPLLILIMLWIPFSTLFGGVQFAIQVFSIKDENDS